MGDPVKTPYGRLGMLIDWRARQIGDPVERLRYLRAATGPGRPGVLASIPWKRTVCGVGGLLVAAILINTMAHKPADGATRPAIRIVTRPVTPVQPAEPPRHAAGTVANPSPAAIPRVWLVDRKPDHEIYSNGLRIETSYAVANDPRGSYPVYRLEPAPDLLSKVSNGSGEQPVSWRTEPAGIVYHSTESLQVPFLPEETQQLKRVGRNLIEYVREKRAYHYLIDRFGRAFRIVNEGDVAYHAGKSLWADSRGVYINLNTSFIGVAFESATAADDMTAAQIHTARVLTEMLRSKYEIPASDCIPHAQVSVNPHSMRIGYHMDWARGFPFAALGLPDNYALPLASVYEFGFIYDEAFLKAVGGHPWPGALSSTEQVERQAALEGFRVAQYRKRLEDRYRKILSSLQARSSEESTNETQ
jgi:N-acetylmuramoyl-L-alanine amidase